MKITLVHSGKQPYLWAWKFDIGGELLTQRSGFQSFHSALRDAETFHLGLSSVPIFDVSGLLSTEQKNSPDVSEHSSIRCYVLPQKDEWIWKICDASDALLMKSPNSYKSFEDALSWISSFVHEMYFDTECITQDGPINAILFSKKYREEMGLIDEHPSAQQQR